MAWIQLTAPAFTARLSPSEVGLLTDEAVDPDAKVLLILEQTAQEVASRVNAGRRKRGLAPVTGTGRYVPPGSQRHAYSIARKMLTDAFPALDEYNGKDRQKAATDAEDHLDDLANNNADADDDGALDFITSTAQPMFFGGSALQDFTTF